MRSFVSKQSSAADEHAGQLIRDYNYLFGQRGTWNNHWTEIAQRIWPNESFLFQNLGQTSQQGDKRTQELYDSTGVMALDRFGAILDSLLTPRDTFWHSLGSQDSAIAKNAECKIWFDLATQILFKNRYSGQANFSGQNQLVYKSLGAYGTGCMFVDELQGGRGIRYKNVSLSQLYIQENHQGIVDSVCRDFMLTARQAYQQFGEALPEGIKQTMENAPEQLFKFLHWVKPRYERDPKRKDAAHMPYASYYVSVEGNKVVWEGGYRCFPIPTSRYEQTPNEAYGRSPAMNVLPALKTLNEMKKVMLKQAHRTVDPVLLAADDGIVDAINLTPGAVNYGGVTADGRSLVQALQVGNVQAGAEFMQEERSLIQDAFLVSLFQILAETPQMSATEVMERTREKGILMAPTIGRQQSEYLDPLIERELDILQAQGQLPPMPRILREAKGEYKTIYDSPISRTQKSEWASGAMRAMEVFANYASVTGKSEILDTINIVTASQEIAEIYGVPAHWLSTPEELAEKKMLAQRAAAMQATIQAAPAMASMAKSGIAPPAPAQQGGPRRRAAAGSPLGNAPAEG